MSTQIIHKNYFIVTKKFCTHSRISDKHDIDSSQINIITSMKAKVFEKTGLKTNLQKQLFFSDITGKSNLYPSVVNFTLGKLQVQIKACSKNNTR